MDIYIDFVD